MRHHLLTSTKSFAAGSTASAPAHPASLAQRPAPFEVAPDEAFLQHLDQNTLARRWRISPRSLERWRWLRQGPPYLKVGGKVLYRISDIEAFEQAQLRQAGK